MRERVEGGVGKGLGARLQRAGVVRVAAASDLHHEIAHVPTHGIGQQVVDRGPRRDAVAHDPQRLLERAIARQAHVVVSAV